MIDDIDVRSWLKDNFGHIDMSAKGKKPSKRLIKDFLEAVYSKEDTK